MASSLENVQRRRLLQLAHGRPPRMQHEAAALVHAGLDPASVLPTGSLSGCTGLATLPVLGRLRLLALAAPRARSVLSQLERKWRHQQESDSDSDDEAVGFDDDDDDDDDEGYVDDLELRFAEEGSVPDEHYDLVGVQRGSGLGLQALLDDGESVLSPPRGPWEWLCELLGEWCDRPELEELWRREEALVEAVERAGKVQADARLYLDTDSMMGREATLREQAGRQELRQQHDAEGSSTAAGVDGEEAGEAVGAAGGGGERAAAAAAGDGAGGGSGVDVSRLASLVADVENASEAQRAAAAGVRQQLVRLGEVLREAGRLTLQLLRQHVPSLMESGDGDEASGGGDFGGGRDGAVAEAEGLLVLAAAAEEDGAGPVSAAAQQVVEQQQQHQGKGEEWQGQAAREPAGPQMESAGQAEEREEGLEGRPQEGQEKQEAGLRLRCSGPSQDEVGTAKAKRRQAEEKEEEEARRAFVESTASWCLGAVVLRAYQGRGLLRERRGWRRRSLLAVLAELWHVAQKEVDRAAPRALDGLAAGSGGGGGGGDDGGDVQRNVAADLVEDVRGEMQALRWGLTARLLQWQEALDVVAALRLHCKSTLDARLATAMDARLATALDGRSATAGLARQRWLQLAGMAAERAEAEAVRQAAAMAAAATAAAAGDGGRGRADAQADAAAPPPPPTHYLELLVGLARDALLAMSGDADATKRQHDAAVANKTDAAAKSKRFADVAAKVASECPNDERIAARVAATRAAAARAAAALAAALQRQRAAAALQARAASLLRLVLRQAAAYVESEMVRRGGGAGRGGDDRAPPGGDVATDGVGGGSAAGGADADARADALEWWESLSRMLWFADFWGALPRVFGSTAVLTAAAGGSGGGGGGGDGGGGGRGSSVAAVNESGQAGKRNGRMGPRGRGSGGAGGNSSKADALLAEEGAAVWLQMAVADGVGALWRRELPERPLVCLGAVSLAITLRQLARINCHAVLQPTAVRGSRWRTLRDTELEAEADPHCPPSGEDACLHMGILGTVMRSAGAMDFTSSATADPTRTQGLAARTGRVLEDVAKRHCSKWECKSAQDVEGVVLAVAQARLLRAVRAVAANAAATPATAVNASSSDLNNDIGILVEISCRTQDKLRSRDRMFAGMVDPEDLRPESLGRLTLYVVEIRSARNGEVDLHEKLMAPRDDED